MNSAVTLLEARRRAKLTQGALASRCGLKQPAVSRIERGLVDPGVGMLDLLLAACGESLEALPRLGAGIDTTLVRQALRRTPAERLRYVVSAARAVEGLRRPLFNG